MFKFKLNFDKRLLPLGFLVVALLFFRCSSQDLEFIQPYQFVVENITVEPLPPVTETEPPVAEPPAPVVREPEVVTVIINDIENAESEDDVEEETVQILTAVVDFVEAQDDEKEEAVAQKAEALDEDVVGDVLREDAELDERILATAVAAAASDEIGNLFPEIELPTLPGDIPGGRLIFEEFDEIEEIEIDLELFRINTLVGPCATTAQNAYDVELNNLNTQRTNNLNTAEQNFNRRVSEADARLNARNLAALNNYRASLLAVQSFINSYLRAAASIQRFSPRLASNLRYYALLYMYYYRFIIDESYRFNLEANARFRTQEVNNATTLRQQTVNTINTQYNTRLAELNTALRNALDNCHNQGTGN